MQEELDLEKRAKSDRRKKIIALSAVGLILAIPIAGYLFLWSLMHVSEREASQNFNTVIDLLKSDSSIEIVDEEYHLASSIMGRSVYYGAIKDTSRYADLEGKILRIKKEWGLNCENIRAQYLNCIKGEFDMNIYTDEDSSTILIQMTDNGKDKRFD